MDNHPASPQAGLPEEAEPRQRAERTDSPNQQGRSPSPKKARRRWPRWARALVFIAVCLAALLGGMAAGYVYIGGQPLSDIWKLETWKHVFDLIFAP